jgi:FkbM family methyltransferase
MAREVIRGWHAFGEGRLRWTQSVLIYRLLRLRQVVGDRTVVRVETRGGTEIWYRRNRGDIQGLREVWLEEAYRLPLDASPKTIVDLGANIGLTSLWLAERHPGCRLVAVEPDPTNVALLRRNLAANGLDATIISAAVGPRKTQGAFAHSSSSNLGRLDPTGTVAVEVVDMPDVLEALGGHADLVKMDIEGGEGPLLSGDLSWLSSVAALIVEFHPAVVDYTGMTQLLEANGFRFHPAGTLVAADYFDRPN